MALVRTLGIFIRTFRDSALLQCCLLKTRARKVRHLFVAPRPSIRKSITRLDLQPNAYFHVYWKRTDSIGEGPCVSFYVFENEVLRFDCFGKGKGHFHVNLGESLNVTTAPQHRLFFFEESVDDQIDRVGFELRVNCRYYLQRNEDTRTARFNVDPNRMLKITKEIDRHLRLLQRCRLNGKIEADAA